MRLIDADALIESLNESRNECAEWAHDCRCNDDMRGIDIFVQAEMTFVECILRTKEQPVVQQWIPVTERLPDASRDLEGFLCTVDWRGTKDVFVEVFHDGKFGGFVFVGEGSDEKFVPNEDVTAWMEMPEPYKEG